MVKLTNTKEGTISAVVLPKDAHNISLSRNLSERDHMLYLFYFLPGDEEEIFIETNASKAELLGVYRAGEDLSFLLPLYPTAASFRKQLITKGINPSENKVAIILTK